MIADLQRRTEESRLAGREVVSMPPRPVEPRPEPVSQPAKQELREVVS
jgi:hypothetical protein